VRTIRLLAHAAVSSGHDLGDWVPATAYPDVSGEGLRAQVLVVSTGVAAAARVDRGADRRHPRGHARHP